MYKKLKAKERNGAHQSQDFQNKSIIRGEWKSQCERRGG